MEKTTENLEVENKEAVEVNGNEDTKVNNGTDTNTNGSAEETLTEEMVKKLIQSETDRIRTEYSKRLKEKDAQIEEIKKSKMTEQEKAEYEHNILQQQLEERERALQEKEEAFMRSQLELQTIDLLKENNLPLEAKTFLVGTNIDVTTENISAFKDMFDNAVENVIKERIKGTHKEYKETGNAGGITIEQFRAMNYQQRNELQRTSPEIYTSLTKQLI